MSDPLRDAALDYHRAKPPGKLAMVATKPLANQRDLALAYSPGVAAACERIALDPHEAATLTARGNLVAVISNGTAVLGLGAIGPLAAKPVMEGKAVLFKKFAGIDAFDIEIDERDPEKLVDIVAALEPTFGAINLEDIKAPECFEVETKLRARMRIPVFHDDQHGTAIIVAAAMLNGLRLLNKRIEDVRLTVCGAGAAALACLDLLITLGLRQENMLVVDIEGVVYAGRTALMDPYKARYARETEKRTLAEAIEGADVFLGLSAPRLVTQAMVRTMAERPLIFALANPVPEIEPEEAQAARPDALIATGRSDYPNQVNNVLCFPVHLPGCPRRRRHHDQSGNEDRLRAGDRRGRPDHRARDGRRGVRAGQPVVRPRLLHSESRSTRASRSSCRSRSPGRPWRPAWRPARSPTSRPTGSGCPSSCSGPA